MTIVIVLSVKQMNKDLLKNITYDAKGQIVKETDAYGQVTTHTYDAVGHEIKTVDGKGNTTSNEYDGDNLVKTTECKRKCYIL